MECMFRFQFNKDAALHIVQRIWSSFKAIIAIYYTIQGSANDQSGVYLPR